MESYSTNSDDVSGVAKRVAWLLIIRSSREDSREFELKPGQNNIGRERDNHIVLHDSAVSSYHAEIYYDQTKATAMIRDLDSTNGTFVNGKRIDKHQTLHHEDQIRVNSYLMTINHIESQLLRRQNAHNSRTNVTSELILESIDHYGVRECQEVCVNGI